MILINNENMNTYNNYHTTSDICLWDVGEYSEDIQKWTKGPWNPLGYCDFWWVILTNY